MNSPAVPRHRRWAWAAVFAAVVLPVAACAPGAPVTSGPAAITDAGLAVPGSTGLHAPAEGAAAPVFRTVADTTAQAGGGVGVTRSRDVVVNTRALPPAGARTPEKVDLPVFANTTVTVDLAPATHASDGSEVWSGKVAGDSGSTVALVEKNGVVAGLINGRNGTYRLSPMANGMTRVEQIDQSQFSRRGDEHVDPPSKPGDPRFPSVSDDAPVSAAAAPPATAAPGSPRSMADVSTSPATSTTATTPVPPVAAAVNPGPTVTILVGYTTAAMQGAGSEAAMAADIQALIAETNTAFADSGINIDLELAGTVEEPTNGPVTGTTLSQVANPGDGAYDDLQVQRDQLGADLVSLVVDSPGGPYCGIAYVMNAQDTSFAPWAASVTDLGCATGYGAFTHELGHNFGAAHDRADGSTTTSWSGTSIFPYGYDWIDPKQNWETVMAYPNACAGCQHLLRYSNPDQTYDGDPMGATIGQPNQADNRAVLNTTASIVASFRGPAVPASLTLTGPTSGQAVAASGTVTATWTATGNVGSKVKVDLFKGGTFVRTLATAAPVGTGYYTYPLPLSTPRGTDYSLKVTPVLSPDLAVQSPNFSVVDPAITPTYTLTNPTEGGTANVSWTYTGAPGGSVRVELLKDGRSIANLAPGAALGTGGRGNVNVTFPAALNNGGGYTFRTTLTAVPTAQAVTSSFSVTSSRQLTVTGPGAGATVTGGSPLTVTWTASGNLGTLVRADLVKNGTVVYSAAGVNPATGTVTFTPPVRLPTGADYQLQLTSVTYPTILASSGTLSFTGSTLSVTSQSSASSVVAGAPVTITVSATGNPGTAVALTAVAAGHTPVTIAGNVPLTTGAYVWHVPLNVPQADWTVHAVAVGNTLVTGDAAAPLTVSWPTLSVADPGAAVSGADVTVDWAYSDGVSAPVRVLLMQSGRTVTTLSGSAATGSDGTGSLTTRLPINVQSGSYTVEVAAVANAAILATSASPLTVTAPTISVTNPTGAVAGANLTVGWNYSDGASAAVRIRLMQGSTAVLTLSGGAPTAATGTGSLTYRLPLTLKQGNYRVEVAAAANTAILTTSGVSLAVTWPVVTVTAPSSAVAGANVTVNWALSDGAVAPMRVRLLNSGTVAAILTGSGSTDSNGNGNVTYRLPVTLAPGTYSIDVAATTNTGIVGTAGGLSVSRPTLTGSGSSGVARGGTATLSWQFSGGASVPVRIDLVSSSGSAYTVSAAVATTAGGTGTFLWRAPATLAPGTYTLRIRPSTMATSSAIEAARSFTVS